MIKRKQKFLVIKQKNSVTKVNVNDIRYIEIFKHDIIIQLKDNRAECYGTLKEFEDDLDGCGIVK